MRIGILLSSAALLALSSAQAGTYQATFSGDAKGAASGAAEYDFIEDSCGESGMAVCKGDPTATLHIDFLRNGKSGSLNFEASATEPPKAGTYPLLEGQYRQYARTHGKEAWGVQVFRFLPPCYRHGDPVVECIEQVQSGSVTVTSSGSPIKGRFTLVVTRKVPGVVAEEDPMKTGMDMGKCLGADWPKVRKEEQQKRMNKCMEGNEEKEEKAQKAVDRNEQITVSGAFTATQRPGHIPMSWEKGGGAPPAKKRRPGGKG